MDVQDALRRGGLGVRRRWGRLVEAGKRKASQNPGQECAISWKPSVFAPVFYGYQDTTAILPQVVHPALHAEGSASALHAEGSDPGSRPSTAKAGASHEGGHAGASGPTRPPQGLGHPVRVWFPSLDGSPQHAPILQGCGRYPLVILAHGSCPQDEHHYRLWHELPATLARSGYVVIVPDLRLGAPSGNETEQALIGGLSAWARSGWEHADVVMPAPATGLVGHSWGAGLLGHVAAEAPEMYGAYVSLSGVEVPGDMHRSHLPTLFTWGEDLGLEVLGVQVSQWEALTPPAHIAELHHAGHWDYLPAGRSQCDIANGVPQRGSCRLTPFLAADIVACFMTRYVRPEGVPVVQVGPVKLNVISPSLRPPWSFPKSLTREQQFYAGGHLHAWGAVTSREDCGVTLRWVVDGQTGELKHH